MTRIAHGFILHPRGIQRGRRALIQLFGRLTTGEAFLVEEDRFEPYFFVDTAGSRAFAAEREIRIELAPERGLAGETLRRVDSVLMPSTAVSIASFISSSPSAQRKNG